MKWSVRRGLRRLISFSRLLIKNHIWFSRSHAPTNQPTQWNVVPRCAALDEGASEVCGGRIMTMFKNAFGCVYDNTNYITAVGWAGSLGGRYIKKDRKKNERSMN